MCNKRLIVLFINTCQSWRFTTSRHRRNLSLRGGSKHSVDRIINKKLHTVHVAALLSSIHSPVTWCCSLSSIARWHRRQRPTYLTAISPDYIYAQSLSSTCAPGKQNTVSVKHITGCNFRSSASFCSTSIPRVQSCSLIYDLHHRWNANSITHVSGLMS